MRPLRPEELCKACGADGAGLPGVSWSRQLELVLRSLPRELGRGIAARTAARIVEGVIAEAGTEVGMRNHPEEESVRARARQWFRAWRNDPDWPSSPWGIPRKEERVQLPAPSLSGLEVGGQCDEKKVAFGAP